MNYNYYHRFTVTVSTSTPSTSIVLAIQDLAEKLKALYK